MFNVVAVGNCETIKAMGRSDVYLKIEVIKKAGYFLTIGAFIAFSKTPQIMALSSIVCTCIQIVVNSYPNRKLIEYQFYEQIYDIGFNLIQSILMCVVVMIIGEIISNKSIALCMQIISGIIIYFLLSFVLRNSSLIMLIDLKKSLFRRNRE